MPGAGSLKVVNFLYSAAPKDGTSFGTFGRGVVMEPLLERSPGAKFEATKLTWIGSVTDEVSVCAFHARTGIKTFADLKASKKPIAVGGTGPGSNTDIYATLVKNALGAPIKLVTGYPGGSELNLAIQRGELDGRCGWSWSSLRAQERAMYDAKEIALVAQIGLKRHPEIGDVPLVTELTDSPNDKAMMRLIVSREAMARPFAAPPGIPADRAKALREAFDATMKDAEFLAEAERLQFEVRPMTGAEVDALVKDIYASPPEVVNRAIEVMKPSK
jgi:tripartite-type tricarboxylate transporter receptor subunit TctC